jgi:hypothetical protein
MKANYERILLTGEDRPDLYSVHKIYDVAPMVKPAVQAEFSGVPINYPVSDGFEACDTNIVPINQLSIPAFEFEYGCEKNNFVARYNDSSDIENSTLASFEIKDSQGVSHWINYKLFGATPSGNYIEGNKILYTNVMPDIDLEYIVDTWRLKENIIIKSPRESYSYSFSLKLDTNTHMELQSDGSVFFKDVATNELVYRIEKPYAVDAQELRTEKVQYTLGKLMYNGIEYDSIEVVIEDIEFIANAVFPIVVDPTTTYEITDGAKDGQVAKSASLVYPPNTATSANTSLTTATARKSGFDSEGTQYFESAVIKFIFNTSSIDDLALINSATFRGYVHATVDGDNRSIIGDWQATTTISAADYTDLAGTTAIAGVDLTGLSSVGWKDFVLQNYATGINKIGETALRLGISGGISYLTNQLVIRTFEYTGAYKPTLIVTYNSPPTAPVLLTPNGGETYNVSANITWTPSTDPDADAITYEIDYSVNNGGAWANITTTATGASYTWNTSAIPASTQCLVRIRAKDSNGLYSSYDQSNAVFTIQHNFGKKIMGVQAPAKVMGSVVMKVLGNS